MFKKSCPRRETQKPKSSSHSNCQVAFLHEPTDSIIPGDGNGRRTSCYQAPPCAVFSWESDSGCVACIPAGKTGLTIFCSSTSSVEHITLSFLSLFALWVPRSKHPQAPAHALQLASQPVILTLCLRTKGASGICTDFSAQLSSPVAPTGGSN